MDEKFCKEMKIMKKVEMLEIKISRNQIKTSVHSIISRTKNIRDGRQD
jgi:hypothetical protein